MNKKKTTLDDVVVSTDRPGTALAADTAMLLDNQLCFALYAASLAMTKAYRPLLAEIGLTYPQYIVMLALWQSDRVSVSDLSTRVVLDSGTLTPLLKRMEQAGWLVRSRDKTDERRVMVSLTPSGRALYKKAVKVRSQVACATTLSPDAGQRLTRVLAGLRQSLCALG